MQVFAWQNVEKEVLNPKISRKVFSGEKITMAQLFMAKDAVVPLHHHENEQISTVVGGAIKVHIEGRELVLRAGDVIHIPPNVPHKVEALEDSEALEVFSPIRSDWLTGKDDYLRR